jgi:hypothetical protein
MRGYLILQVTTIATTTTSTTTTTRYGGYVSHVCFIPFLDGVRNRNGATKLKCVKQNNI